MFSGSLAFLADSGHFPRAHANVASMPVEILCATLNAMTTEVYAANLMRKSATISSAKTALITHAAYDALTSPDAQFLALLMQGKVKFRCSWFEIFYGTLPFAAWAAMAAAAYFVGEVAPQLAAFLAFLDANTMVSDTGAPSVQPIYLELRKFLAAASTLGFAFSVKSVFTSMVAKVEEVGPIYSSTWDPLYLKVLLARRDVEHDEDVPLPVLMTLASDLGTYAAAEALLQSLRTSGGHPSKRVAAAHSMQKDAMIPGLMVPCSPSSAHLPDGCSPAAPPPSPALAAAAVPAPPSPTPCAAAPAASPEDVSGVPAPAVTSASPACAFLIGVRSVLGMWESGLLPADEAFSRVVSSLADFRTINSPAGVVSAPPAELPQARRAGTPAVTASTPATSAAPASPPGIPLPAGPRRPRRLGAVAALAHPTFSSDMYDRRVRFTCLQVSSRLNGQHGTIVDIYDCDGT